MKSEAVAYCEYLDHEGIDHDDICTLESGLLDVETRWTLSASGGHITVRALFDDDDHTVAMRAFKIANANDNAAKIIVACNTLNNKYRWVKFVLDDDNDVNMEADLCVSDETAGPDVTQLLLRMVHIADDAYPVLMKALWA